ncbi:MAG: hypothetical protein HPY66_0968 [Firmicutes bacterium]|nr:hypothetical protein [Bacillota bacterium]MDI6705972.1 polymer-forming cytoskeletal protein [Bacillota bacterium]
MLSNQRANHEQSAKQGTVIVRGKINGSILHAKKVIITDSGYFKGDIVSDLVEVYGVLRGNIESSSIEVFPSGRLYCENISYGDITMHDGGVIVHEGNRETSSFNRVVAADVSKPIIEIEGAENTETKQTVDTKPTFYSSI